MPIYEEKLINPLALRFTQEHIRTTFRDGRSVDQSFDAIKVRPGTGEYDLILEAPFPNIEIIRWYQRVPGHLEPDADHWFTLDNRRLYCLQRAAAKHWPKRVAAVAQLLYSAPHSARQKDDSSTAGRAVRLGAKSGQDTQFWDWRGACGAARCPNGHRTCLDADQSPWACDTCHAIMPSTGRHRCLECDYDLCGSCHLQAPRALGGPGSSSEELAASAQVAADDGKTTMVQLTDAPSGPSLLDQVLGLVPLKGRGSSDSEDSTQVPGSTGGSEPSLPEPVAPKVRTREHRHSRDRRARHRPSRRASPTGARTTQYQ